MTDTLHIRCKTDLPLCQAQAQLAYIFNVPFEKTPQGSYLFSALGVDGAVYELPTSTDDRVRGYDTVIDISLYAVLTGRMYSEIPALFEITLFLASFVAQRTTWHCFVCTPGGEPIEELTARRTAGP